MQVRMFRAGVESPAAQLLWYLAGCESGHWGITLVLGDVSRFCFFYCSTMFNFWFVHIHRHNLLGTLPSIDAVAHKCWGFFHGVKGRWWSAGPKASIRFGKICLHSVCWIRMFFSFRCVILWFWRSTEPPSWTEMQSQGSAIVGFPRMIKKTSYLAQFLSTFGIFVPMVLMFIAVMLPPVPLHWLSWETSLQTNVHEGLAFCILLLVLRAFTYVSCTVDVLLFTLEVASIWQNYCS